MHAWEGGGVKFLHEEQLPVNSTKQDSKHTDGTGGVVQRTDIPLRHNHTNRQAAAAASPMQAYGDALLDSPN